MFYYSAKLHKGVKIRKARCVTQEKSYLSFNLAHAKEKVVAYTLRGKLVLFQSSLQF